MDGNELKESIFDMDLDSLISESSCNTRKVRISIDLGCFDAYF